MSLLSRSWLLTATTIPLLTLGLFSGCRDEVVLQKSQDPEVTVEYPVEKPVIDYLDFTGTTRSVESVEIRARVNGYLESIHFKDGSTVNKDDLLFVLEPAPFKAELAAAKAALAKAKASEKLAEAELQRIRPLVTKQALSEQELDLKESQLATAIADVAAAQAALDRAQLNLDYTQIKAPQSGRIGRHLISIGNLVQAESTVLTHIESYEPIHAYFSISENELLRFASSDGNLQLPQFADGKRPEIYLGLSNLDSYPYKGELDFTETGVDPQTGTTTLRGIFKNEDRSLIPGLFVRIRVPVSEAKPRLLINERAVGVDQRGEFLLVVNSEGIVEYRPVKLGVLVDGMRVVESGVTKQDQVIVNGLQRVFPSAKAVAKFASDTAGSTPASNAPESNGTAPEKTTEDTDNLPVDDSTPVTETQSSSQGE